MEDKTAAHVVVHGRVQGVFFRLETQRAAHRFGVTGWVRNLPDGNVEAVFEGDREAVENAISWCRTGSPRAEVTTVDTEWRTFSGRYRGFDITY